MRLKRALGGEGSRVVVGGALHGPVGPWGRRPAHSVVAGDGTSRARIGGSSGSHDGQRVPPGLRRAVAARLEVEKPSVSRPRDRT